jgi:hypothetical protein
METELTAEPVKLRKDGTIVQAQDGKDVVVAHYSRETGHLEFETKEGSVKLYQQVTARIGTVSKGTQPSGLVIRTIGVKGEKRPDLAGIPKRPKMGKLGDCTPEVVEWFFEYNLPEAIIRYGVYLDNKGKPVRKDARRLVKTIVDNRELEDDQLEWVKQGKNTQAKAPVSEQGELVEAKNAIIARRATHLTFTPKEAVGGFELEDEMDSIAEESE